MFGMRPLKPFAPVIKVLLMPVWLLSCGWAVVEGNAGFLPDTEGGDSFNPPSYSIFRAPGRITVDGRIDEVAWAAAPWTSDFVDIEGGDRPPPRLRTRAKMLWDDEALYVAALLEEPDVWATLTERDAAIYQDNAFEVFIDPDGDTHNYYELEVNALGTLWDLIILKPHRDGGPSLSAWDIRGLEAGVHVDGTVNDPTDSDAGWTVELALPWEVLEEAAPERRAPREGEQWRLNFARSQWPLTVLNGAYEKEADADAEWWVWSPQGAVDMHRPERFGYVQFSGAPPDEVPVRYAEDTNERVKWALRRLYYRQRDYRESHGRYTNDPAELHADEIAMEGVTFEPELSTTQSGYEITARGAAGTTVHIRHDGKVWTTDRNVSSRGD